MALTYQELLEKLYEMSPLELKQPVQLRDYGNEETHEAIDFIPLAIGSKPQIFQIGFHERE
jgi:hypothetical protein